MKRQASKYLRFSLTKAAKLAGVSYSTAIKYASDPKVIRFRRPPVLGKSIVMYTKGMIKFLQEKRDTGYKSRGNYKREKFFETRIAKLKHTRALANERQKRYYLRKKKRLRKLFLDEQILKERREAAGELPEFNEDTLHRYD